MSSIIPLSTLDDIDLRDAWPDEAKNFTPWMFNEGCKQLSGTIGIDIIPDAIESSVGSFRCDILAHQNGTDNIIVIENQLEKTDHIHLGELLTYASGKNAKIIIWVVKDAREEHQSAIKRLNEITSNDIGFYLVRIKLYSIDGSNPAPKFEIIEAPNNYEKSLISFSSSTSSLSSLYYLFFSNFNNYADNNKPFRSQFTRRTPQKGWMDFYISPDIFIRISTSKSKYEISIKIFINSQLYDNLFSNREYIESELGPLNWVKRDLDEKDSIISIIKGDIDFDDEESWEPHFDWIIEILLKIKEILRNLEII